MGMLLQNYVLAVQNTVDVTQVGSASATVAFFRSLGGAVGVSVLGAILAAQVRDDVTTNLAREGISADGSAGSLLDVNSLPGPVAEIVRAAYGDATGHIFAVAAGVAVISVVAALFIREIPCAPRSTSGTDTGGGAGPWAAGQARRGCRAVGGTSDSVSWRRGGRAACAGHCDGAGSTRCRCSRARSRRSWPRTTRCGPAPRACR